MSSGFPTGSDTNRTVQPLEMANGLKFRINEVGLSYLCSENKCTDQLRGYRAVICALFLHMQNAGFVMTKLKYDHFNFSKKCVSLMPSTEMLLDVQLEDQWYCKPLLDYFPGITTTVKREKGAMSIF